MANLVVSLGAREHKMRNDLKPILNLVPEEQSPTARQDIMRALLASIRDIELQLGSRIKRKNLDGSLMTPVELAIWRVKAIKALNYSTDLYRRYKALESQYNEKRIGQSTTSLITRLASFFGARAPISDIGEIE